MKRLLFVCVENSCRSQMAEGFARTLGRGDVEAFSSGSRPSGVVDPRAIGFMKEKGIDISGHRSKGFNALPVKEFYFAVSMGCADICPLVPGARHVAWDMRDPKNLSDDEFRKVRDEIEERVKGLFSGIEGAQ
jgi:protein-tyrosine-phosphatase